MTDDVYKVFDNQVSKISTKCGFVFYCSSVEDSDGRYNHAIQRAVIDVNNPTQLTETIDLILSQHIYPGADSDVSPNYPLFVSKVQVLHLTDADAFNYVWGKIIHDNTKVDLADNVYVNEKLRFAYKIRAGAKTESKECSGNETSMRDFVNAIIQTNYVLKHPLITGVIITPKENS